MASPTLRAEPADNGDRADPRGPGGFGSPAFRDTILGRRWSGRWRALRSTGGLRILGALAAGVAWYLSTAPRTWWWSAILGFVLLGFVLHGRRLRAAAGLSFLAGAAYFLPLLSWTGVYVGSVPWFGLALLEAALVIPPGMLIAVVTRRLPLWPVFGAAAWLAGEALRARFPFGGFPWGGIAFTQSDGPLLPAASLIGSAGLSFLVALAGFGAADLLRRRADRGRPAGWAAVVLMLMPFAVGAVGLLTEQDTSSAPQRQVAIIQGNVPRAGLDFNSQRRAVLDNHVARTHELAEAVRAGTSPQPSLVIWPENSSDIDPYRNADAAAVISEAAADIGVPILVGAVVGTDDPTRNLNQGIVWDPVTGPGQTYTKRHPVPFAEYMPWRGFFRFFSDKVDLLRNEFLPGDAPGNLDVAGVNVGDVICFEVVEDRVVRDVVTGGAQVLVVQTNNATFGYTDETYQQQAMSRVRAVEHGRDVLIAATSGVSAVIRSDGSVESTIGLFTPGFLTPDIGLNSTITPGTVLGGPIEWLITLLTPLALAGALMRQRRSSTPAGRTARPNTQEGVL
ncbi:MAG: apolipoprotein N-acyltransferase [Nakamurella sp.]